MSTDLAVIILAAGRGSRMRSALPKVLHPVGGLPLLGHIMATARPLKPMKIVCVVGDNGPQIAGRFADLALAVQDTPLGTGHAVMAGLAGLGDFQGDVLVLAGDTPLIRTHSLTALIRTKQKGGHAMAVLGFRPADPTGYGRLIRDGQNQLAAIVEERDADEAERAEPLCNSGMMVFDRTILDRLLPRLSDRNAAGEYYLTDLIALARAQDMSVGVAEAPAEECLGVNSRSDLAAAEAAFQTRRREEIMAAGVTLADPATVYFSHDTELGLDCVVEPGVVFGPGVTVGPDCHIKAYSHLEGVTIGPGTHIGPFARLRPGTDIGAGAKIGNFVEVKKSTLADGVKVSHLSYIGDTDIGVDANVGAGTITCNYDGFFKYRSRIGAGAFIGSNTALVAPVEVGEGAIIGAGSVISRSVGAGDMSLTRSEQTDQPGWAKRFRERMAARKQKKA